MERIGRPPQIDYKGMRECEASWHRFGAPSLRTFALGAPVADVEGDRRLPDARTVSSPTAAPPVAPVPVNNGHELMVLAAREWPAVRDSGDPQRLERFERDFAETTFFAEEARRLRQKIETERRRERDAKEKRADDARALRTKTEAETRRDAEEQLHAGEKPQAEERKLRAEGRIPVPVGDRNHGETRWLLPGKGEWFCDIEGGPEMVVVPAGKFIMGSPDNEPGSWHRNEGPQHEVTFTRPFAVGRHAVTRGQFAAFVKATGRRAGDQWRNPGFGQDDSHPVVNVAWDYAKAYASWLAKVTDKPYRLPSEAEWEYAARAGATTPFWWGSAITPAQANYNGNRRGTVPVDSFRPNPWGLYNVHGNVREWCEDMWHYTYGRAPSDGSAWILDAADNGHIARGGSWLSNPHKLRAAFRGGDIDVYDVDGPFAEIGFRLARTLTP